MPERGGTQTVLVVDLADLRACDVVTALVVQAVGLVLHGRELPVELTEMRVLDELEQVIAAAKLRCSRGINDLFQDPDLVSREGIAHPNDGLLGHAMLSFRRLNLP